VSIDDRLTSNSRRKARQPLLHQLHLICRMSLPFRDLRYHPEWFPRAIGERRVARELLVSEVWIIEDRPGRFDDIDALGFSAAGEFGSPDRGIQSA
jgi:hypothetical protein